MTPEATFAWLVLATPPMTALNAAPVCRFSAPVVSYNEDYLGIPVGQPVPAGYYDRARAMWVAGPSGRAALRLGFDAAVATPAAVRPAMIRLVDRARREAEA